MIGDPMYDVDLRAVGAQPGGQRAALLRRRSRRVRARATKTAPASGIDEEVCRYYQVLYGMRTAAFWMSAIGAVRLRPQPGPAPGPHRLVGPGGAGPRRAGPRVLRAAVTGQTETPDLRGRDDAFHFDVMSDRWWETETAWFSFHHPERRLGGWLYSMFRPEHRHRGRWRLGLGRHRPAAVGRAVLHELLGAAAARRRRPARRRAADRRAHQGGRADDGLRPRLRGRRPPAGRRCASRGSCRPSP